MATLPATTNIRDVIHTLVDAHNIKGLDTNTQTIYSRLSFNNCPVRIHTAADNFGSVSWYKFGLYASRVADLSPAQFVQFVKEQFTSYCGDTGAKSLAAQIDEPQWDLIARLHLLYLTMSVVDREKTRNELGFVMTPRRRIRTSTNSVARLASWFL
ncbi:hypothetical protein [Crenobacter cavernae]|uniref:hypothetical protein n=1 Tax=Crenobacter cavernae TaxID=2290923 RepID=UPI0011C07F5E|nr:hypothetical protein [Crenobacter cavernae]